MRTVQNNIFILLIGVGILQFLYYWPLMPGRMASHFDGMGNPNGWQSRSGFFGFSTAMLVFVVLFNSVFPALLHRIPDMLLNIPNKDIWLAPDRRAETLSVVRSRMALFGNALLAFFITTFQLVFQANLTDARRLSSGMWFLLAAYLVFVLVWTIELILKFRRPQSG